jgi:release factor glutamine methyltransferase
VNASLIKYVQIKTLFYSTVSLLRQAGIPEPELEVSLLLSHVLRIERTAVLLAGEKAMHEEQCAAFKEHVARRLAREPLAYITGEKEFWSLPFTVTKDVLIPRPETELLLATVLPVIKNAGGEGCQLKMLDLGTGSGIIAIVLAMEVETARITAIDRSYKALQVAVHNAKKHKVRERIQFVNCDWLAGFSAEAVFDLVVANPPYVAEEILKRLSGTADGSLQPEVVRFEPRLALDGGHQGLDEIRRIATQLPSALKQGGSFFMEIGADQGEAVSAIFKGIGAYESLAVHNDYAGLPRVFQARRN